jgi:hypothetical protein
MAKKNDGTAVEERVKLYAVNKKYKEKPFLVTAVTDTVIIKGTGSPSCGINLLYIPITFHYIVFIFNPTKNP